MNIRVITSTGKVVGVSIFNRAFLKSSLTVGTNVTVFGKYENPLSGLATQNRIVKWNRSVPTLFFSVHPL